MDKCSKGNHIYVTRLFIINTFSNVKVLVGAFYKYKEKVLVDATRCHLQLLCFAKLRWHLQFSCHTVGAESFGHKVNNQHRTHKNRLIVRSLLAKQKKPAKQERRPFSFLLGKLSLQNIQTIIGGNFLMQEENCRTLLLFGPKVNVNILKNT